jgi:DNA-binding NtrC family response regulator
MQTKGRILLVDDDESICNVLDIVLKNEGYDITTCRSASSAMRYFQDASLKDPFDIVLQDIRMPNISGLELIKKYCEIDPNVIILIITAFSDWENAVESMRQGAFDYIKKPFDNELDLKPALQRAMEVRRIRDSINPSLVVDNLKIIGSTAEMKKIYNLVRRIALTNSTVLIQGESGTGKELIARAIHYQSNRAAYPILSVNCAAFGENLLESELFGHIKGSFTNAFSDKKGLLEVSNKGSFFLDECSELSPALQVKLLRVIEAKEFIPVGSTETKKVDVRFIAATNTDLSEQVRKGNFREDLFYRLNVIFIHLPPLRERQDDILLLAGHFLNKYNKIMGKEIKGFSDEVMNILYNHYWQGNIRELENVIQRAIALAENKIIKIEDLGLTQPRTQMTISDSATALHLQDLAKPTLPFECGVNLEDKLQQIEVNYIKLALEKNKYNQIATAKMLGLNLRSLCYKIKKYKII